MGVLLFLKKSFVFLLKMEPFLAGEKNRLLLAADDGDGLPVDLGETACVGEAGRCPPGLPVRHRLFGRLDEDGNLGLGEGCFLAQFAEGICGAH